MIDPLEDRTPAYASLSPCSLYGLLVRTEEDGRLLEYAVPGGHNAMPFAIPHRCAQRLADGYWIITEGNYPDPNGDLNFRLRAGQIVQAYHRADHLISIVGHDSSLNPWLNNMGTPELVVTGYEGVNTFWRGLQHAMKSEVSAAEEMLALCELSNEALGFALDTDLRDQISLDQHRANIAELQHFAASGSGKEMEQVREFLGSMENPYDRISRMNAWRWVLIVRAVQRRASARATKKASNVQDLTATFTVTSAYIADVLADARRMAQKLENHQPWWSGDGQLSEEISRRRRSNLTYWLERQVVSLHLIHAKPFRAWAHRAADEMALFANLLREKAPDGTEMRACANEAVCALRAIALMETISRAIMEEHSRAEDRDSIAGERTRKACSTVLDWGLNPDLLPMNTWHEVCEIVDLARQVQSSKLQYERIDGLRCLENWLAKLAVMRAT